MDEQNAIDRALVKLTVDGEIPTNEELAEALTEAAVSMNVLHAQTGGEESQLVEGQLSNAAYNVAMAVLLSSVAWLKGDPQVAADVAGCLGKLVGLIHSIGYTKAKRDLVGKLLSNPN